MSRPATREPGRTIPSRRRALAWSAAALALIASGAGLWLAIVPAWRVRDAARRASYSGRYDEARHLVDRWLQAEPASAEAHFFRARVALGLDLPGEAEAGLRRAKELGHPDRALALMLAVVAAKQGRHGEAEPVLRRALAESRGPDALIDEALAKVYLETFDLTRAEATIERWARDAPESPKPHLWRVEVDRRKGDDAAAVVRDYREALARDPGLLDARLRLAEELRQAHRSDEAAPEYAAYLARRPDDPAGLLGVGLNALESGDEAAATRYLDRALEFDPRQPQALMERAEIALRRGDNAQALDLFDRAAAVAPEDLKLRYGRSLALARLGRADEARAERAVVERLRAEEAEADRLRRRLALSPRDPALQCQAASWMIAHGHAEEGLRWAEKALRDHPGDPEACRILADHHRRAGNSALANYYRDLSSEPSRGPTPP